MSCRKLGDNLGTYHSKDVDRSKILFAYNYITFVRYATTAAAALQYPVGQMVTFAPVYSVFHFFFKKQKKLMK